MRNCATSLSELQSGFCNHWKDEASSVFVLAHEAFVKKGLLNSVVVYMPLLEHTVCHKIILTKAVANLDSIRHAGCWQCEQEAANKRCGSFGSLCCHGYRAPLVPAMSVQVSALKTRNRSESGL